jgi:L-alanine-DL-glutamate epimerase-like enolase superfamily enzyme
MKIARIESWVLQFPYHPGAADGPGQLVDLPGVFVEAEDGTRGLGFTYAFCRAGRSIKSLIDEVLTPAAIGRDVADRVSLWNELAWKTRRLGHGVNMLALAALDIALWDVAARAQAMPLHRFLGASAHSVPVFASGNYSPALPEDVLLANALNDVERGFGAIKIRIGGRPVEEDLARLRRVRAAVGDNIRLMADAAELLSLAEANWIIPRLEDIGLYWLEEPLPSEDLVGYRELQRRSPFPLAMGEHLLTRFQFLDCLRMEAAQVLQPDVAIVGGVTEYLRIAELAAAHGRAVAPHLVTELHVHLSAAISNTIYVEHFPFTSHLWEDALAMRDGAVVIPERPGLGLTFKPDVFEASRIA